MSLDAGVAPLQPISGGLTPGQIFDASCLRFTAGAPRCVSVFWSLVSLAARPFWPASRGVRRGLRISPDGAGALCGVLALVALCCLLLFSYAYYRVFLRLIALVFLLFSIQQGGALQLTLTARCIFAYENPLALTGAGFLAKRLLWHSTIPSGGLKPRPGIHLASCACSGLEGFPRHLVKRHWR